MSDPLADFLAALDLTDTGARTDEDIFTGPSQRTPHGRVFGGQVLAQTVVAASRTVHPDQAIHSMHAYFLRPGDINLPLTLAVDRIHDGRSFSRRRTQAYQDGIPIFSMIASFQTADAGLDHQVEMPLDIPQPEELIPSIQHVASMEGVVGQPFTGLKAFELRHVDVPAYVEIVGEHKASQAVWMRAVGRLPDDPALHRAALAYASDFTLLESIFRRHGVPIATPGLRAASLDHAMWWHRAGRADEWVLYVQESPTATGGRGLSFGRIYSREGVLLASTAQEGMVRVPA